MEKIEMKDLKEIYTHTKYLDKVFEEKYDIRSEKIVHKYILELLVELSELANEVRCFKFWSSRGPSSKAVILEEYTDCLFMILYFCNITGVQLSEDFDSAEDMDIISCFIDLCRNTCMLEEKLDKEKVKKILVEIIYLGSLLSLNIEDLENGTLNKESKIKSRFKVKEYL